LGSATGNLSSKYRILREDCQTIARTILRREQDFRPFSSDSEIGYRHLTPSATNWSAPQLPSLMGLSKALSANLSLDPIDFIPFQETTILFARQAQGFLRLSSTKWVLRAFRAFSVAIADDEMRTTRHGYQACSFILTSSSGCLINV
jgi:hypothetical protein